MGKSCCMCGVGDDMGIDGRIILCCMLTKQDAREWTGFTSLIYGPVKMIMNLQVTMKAGNFFEFSSECYHLQRECDILS